MIELRNFTESDIQILQQQYPNLSSDQIREIISQWNTKEYRANYFEMFAVVFNSEVVGMVSLYGLTKNIVECGPEIFNAYRKQGLGYQAVLLALQIAKERGYRIAHAQIKADNLASAALHQKLGFETDGYPYQNKKDNAVLIYLKALD